MATAARDENGRVQHVIVTMRQGIQPLGHHRDSLLMVQITTKMRIEERYRAYCRASASKYGVNATAIALRKVRTIASLEISMLATPRRAP